MPKILISSLIVSIIVGGFAANAIENGVETRSIGVIAPLTLGNAKFGEDIKNSVEIEKTRECQVF